MAMATIIIKLRDLLRQTFFHAIDTIIVPYFYVVGRPTSEVGFRLSLFSSLCYLFEFKIYIIIAVNCQLRLKTA
jgi:hypothetical protein